MSVARGRFIAFEGGEGAGKSTQAQLLAEALRALGLAVVTTREPGGTPGAEAIRNLLLRPPGGEWTAEAEALLFAAARADHVARLIR
ncbi:MAG: dTMP kinase, partial [Porphyrobacter sp. HL-46]